MAIGTSFQKLSHLKEYGVRYSIQTLPELKKLKEQTVSDLVMRLRGQYKLGPDGEFGVRDFSVFIQPISIEAANRIEELENKLDNGWISVNDRLPVVDEFPKNNNVRFKLTNGDEFTGIHWDNDWSTDLSFSGMANNWFIGNRFVTHWKPEPPEVKS